MLSKIVNIVKHCTGCDVKKHIHIYTPIIPINPFVSNAYHERDQTPRLVLLHGLFQSVSSQGKLLITGQKSDLDQRDQTCFLN